MTLVGAISSITAFSIPLTVSQPLTFEQSTSQSQSCNEVNF